LPQSYFLPTADGHHGHGGSTMQVQWSSFVEVL
jgi:hypothetical protein